MRLLHELQTDFRQKRQRGNVYPRSFPQTEQRSPEPGTGKV